MMILAVAYFFDQPLQPNYPVPRQIL